ncbi:MAG: globin [Sphingobacterium sp.]|jgi:hemoglobin|uniref:group III truncated hemoglobin n=1 Tax=unclassified Sphingobacterium TaxID=2609468 RepID=UPI000984962F|nr:group III truncated hemoglobin [Sphingobacterium sp. CZ-UAM]MDF2517640.1 globin [Sphingobacterium sp.]OOG17078.1 globin [Sphingobacterium sp. CZ-UAM]
MKQDIQTIEDIKILVDQFYTTVRADSLIGPIFQERIQDNWSVHLEKMYRFWQTILLDEHTYFGSPFPPHIPLPIEAKHFDQWLLLFEATVDRLYKGEKADEAKWRAQKMAQMFQFKKEYFNANPKKKPLI